MVVLVVCLILFRVNSLYILSMDKIIVRVIYSQKLLARSEIYFLIYLIGDALVNGISLRK
jgi:hypothetical protein